MATVEHEAPVLVVGAGPAGLIAALQLASNGTRCMLVERNFDTTKWPKMDITNCRSMEILKRLGIDQGLRDVGVPQDYSFNVNFSTGLSDNGKIMGKWELPSPNSWRARIREQNDGSMPREPYQRCSQAIFEAWLKPKLQISSSIETYFGWKFESLIEKESYVESIVVDAEGIRHIIRSLYVIGCDGAGSKVRTAIGSKLEGGPVPAAMHLIHFKSRDLTRLHQQGQFWHIFFASGSVIISQDEKDTWTVHNPVPLGTDVSKIDPCTAIYTALGGELTPFEIKVDEVLVTSLWRPNIYLANNYTSSGGRVFISGDAAHQNIPTGGYGMNTAVGDSFDIGWKIAAVVRGHGGPHLLDSYEAERRPVAARNIERSGVHQMVHHTYRQWCLAVPKMASLDSDDGAALRAKISEHVAAHNGENTDHGIELGYRYNNSPSVISEDPKAEPTWNYKHYVPSTWPGARAPHLFLSDGQTSIFDLFGTGNEYTLVDFTPEAAYFQAFSTVASVQGVPLKSVHLPKERAARKVWERDAVLVRPDDHVAWRCPESASADTIDVAEILSIVAGKKPSATFNSERAQQNLPGSENAFTGTVGMEAHEKVQDLAAFQH
ncbi:hypothetical protein P152DRAFT_481449 [Eremomyces bilateralis CBS 781.70]|uniref:FAD-binding domain-containing protein n=1 Tax=Eremomyces bilateralis CBS 781.70 TaxID=1392243 RepID=A0A6G1G5Q0_9PEZI|nr:uncharacterized protein P152DRAFT_481449 [Eremomyces bilateralis CBS 781.70]KAF1813348.1 hypothetical protein P152DRAFT_481449 [Eremomyces bilateralis CBS 781.70]